jgi:hypothetical protein
LENAFKTPKRADGQKLIDGAAKLDLRDQATVRKEAARRKAKTTPLPTQEEDDTSQEVYAEPSPSFTRRRTRNPDRSADDPDEPASPPKKKARHSQLSSNGQSSHNLNKEGTDYAFGASGSVYEPEREDGGFVKKSVRRSQPLSLNYGQSNHDLNEEESDGASAATGRA